MDFKPLFKSAIINFTANFNKTFLRIDRNRIGIFLKK